MNGLALIKSVRDALVAEDLGLTGVHIAGAAPAGAALPFVALSVLPSTATRVAANTEQGLDGVQVDVLAHTLGEAMEISDAIDNIVLGLGDVAVAAGASTFGIRRASGSWRTVLPSEPATPGERVERVVTLYTQAEIRPL